MRLDLSNALKDLGQPYPFDCPIEIEDMIVLDDPVRFESVRVHGTATGAGETVTIEGVVEAQVHSRCARCLCDMSQSISANLKQVFAQGTVSPDADVLPLDGTGTELDAIAEEALLLELPIRFLCEPGCAGLCSVCGKNKNKERCTCQEGGDRQNPFSALSDLLEEDEEV